MRACLQRVRQASVTVEQNVVGRIDHGLVVLLGVGADDDEATTRLLADKVVGLRIFADDEHRMNRALADVDGAMLVVSQFTLWADCRKGRRPSFVSAAEPILAEHLYNAFVSYVRQQGIVVETGVFAAQMDVALVNDGPVTIWLDSAELAPRS